MFIDVVAPAPRLLILGAVDYAAALCKLARACGWRPFVCDPRVAFATPARFPEAEEVVAAWPDEAFAQLGIDRATYIAILTHDPKLDDAALRIALRSDAAYVGAMGSRARAGQAPRAADRGRDDRRRARPDGGPDRPRPRRRDPEETALSILAEVVAVRNGRSGGRLGTSAGGSTMSVPDSGPRPRVDSPQRAVMAMTCDRGAAVMIRGELAETRRAPDCDRDAVRRGDRGPRPEPDQRPGR